MFLFQKLQARSDKQSVAPAIINTVRRAGGQITGLDSHHHLDPVIRG